MNEKNLDSITDFGSPKDTSHNWLISYADVVTVLLCFFILFFNQNKISDFANIISSLTPDGSRNKSQGGSHEINHMGISKAGLSEQLVTKLTGLDNVVVNTKQNELMIDFREVAFFNSGAFTLTPAGEEVIDRVVNALVAEKDRIFIEIQGHSDNVPVRFVRGRGFNSNLELSARRSLTVFDHFARKGFEERRMSISGFSHHKPVTEADLGKNRRISFRITSTK